MFAYRLKIYIKMKRMMFYSSLLLSVIVGIGLRVSWEWDLLSKVQIIKNVIVSFCLCYFAYHIKTDYPKRFDFISYQLWLGCCAFFSAYIVMSVDKVVKSGGIRSYLKVSLKKFLADER